MEFLKEWIYWAWEFIAGVFFAIGDAVIGTLFMAMPLNDWLGSQSGLEADFMGFRQTVDGFIPLTEGIGLITAMVTFQLFVLIPIKWVFKVLPGFGG